MTALAVKCRGVQRSEDVVDDDDTPDWDPGDRDDDDEASDSVMSLGSSYQISLSSGHNRTFQFETKSQCVVCHDEIMIWFTPSDQVQVYFIEQNTILF